MSDFEVVKFVGQIFEKICNERTIEGLLKIENSLVLRPFKVDVETYPKLNFTITPSDISLLVSKGFLNADYEIVSNIMNQVTDPFTKFLYACLWKNGDLKKIKHIVKGVSGTSEIFDSALPDEAIVFHQFGRHLSGRTGEPIIDQHVLRSFAIYSEPKLTSIKAWREVDIVKKQHHGLIENYKKWLFSDQIDSDLRQVADYTYYIDRILFATGKSVKISK
jgi:hypothetical protein